MNNHTPGPWIINEETRETPGGHVILRRICAVCTEHGALRDIRINSLSGDLAADECAANARLIREAPNLLEALEDIACSLEGIALTEGQHPREIVRLAIKQQSARARAAIAKAAEGAIPYPW